MRKHWRILSLALAVLMVVAVFAGCKKDEKDPENTTTKPTETRTLGGRTFTIYAGHLHQQWVARPEESELEAEKQAIYDKLQDDLDFKLEFVDGGDLETILASLMSGTIPGDVSGMKMAAWLPLAVQKLILPFDDSRIVAAGLNYKDPTTFFQPFTLAQSYGDKVYGVMWNGSHFICEFGWCIYFNKQLVADAGVEDLYQVVRDMKWDWDFFRNLAKDATKDVDGDGVIDVYGDGTFGYGTEVLTIDGGEVMRMIDGKMTVVLDEPAAIEALEFVRQFAVLDGSRHPLHYGDVHREFTNGKVAMVWGEQWNTRADDLGFQTTSVDYGLVPMPKAPNTNYYVNALGGVYSVSIFAGLSDDRIADSAYVLSEMGRRFTNDDWQEAYRDVDLKGDAQALEMVIDYIWPHTKPDYTWASDSVREMFRNMIYLPMIDGEGTPNDLVSRYISTMQAEVDALFKQ